MKQRFVVIAIFVRPDWLGSAKIGQAIPWSTVNHETPSAPFTNFGLKSPFLKREIDPLFMVEANGLPIGYARVFETQRMAEFWFEALVEKRSPLAYWCTDIPIGPRGSLEDYKSVAQFVRWISIISVRTFTSRGGAESALKNFQSGTRTLRRFGRVAITTPSDTRLTGEGIGADY